MTATGRVLIVDDEPNALKVLSAILADEGYQVSQALSVSDAFAKITENLDAVITDMRMPGNDGMQLFEQMTESFPDIPVIFLTAFGTVDSAVQAMTKGAFYYIIKPPDYPSLKGILARAVDQRRLKRELESLKKRLASEDKLTQIIGRSAAIRRVLQVIEAVRDSESSVLICGETGTGKELVARDLHFTGNRRNRPFVAVNCAAIPRELIEAELFGYEKGAFTGASTQRIGRVEQASGGTLFLDEIGELELSVQAKLLRVLQEKEIERIGSNRRVQVDFRLVSSTNRDLPREIMSGNFRRDLYYRLNVVEIGLPPLRERREDIPFLVAEFVKEFCIRERKTLVVSETTIKKFLDYSWPGNIRQLRNVVERAFVLAKGNTITDRDLPEEMFEVETHRQPPSATSTLKQIEARAIRDTLERCQGNKSQAAKILGFSRKALYKRLRDFDIS
ncbi:MAG TPA: sigma-54 dependent transcriptional regulator [Desulfuromonadales bacterium]|nr:sigma-54 dependent transcriptional regulator [Desulfuromonadales bacterium]